VGSQSKPASPPWAAPEEGSADHALLRAAVNVVQLAGFRSAFRAQAGKIPLQG